jgi:hypothetical protein
VRAPDLLGGRRRRERGRHERYDRQRRHDRHGRLGRRRGPIAIYSAVFPPPEEAKTRAPFARAQADKTTPRT